MSESFAENYTLNEFQKNLHVLTEEEKQSGYRMMSPFVKFSRTKSSHYIQSYKTLKAEVDPGSPGNVQYYINTVPYHGLLSTGVEQSLPVISTVTPSPDSDVTRYEICWVENLLLDIIQTVSAEFDNKQLTQFNNGYCIAEWQTCVYETTRENISKNIGNIPQLLRWSQVLPSWDLSYTLPMFYSKHPDQFFPLILCGDNKFIHRLTLERNISKLLRMREVRVIDGAEVYRIIPFEREFIKIGKSRKSPNTDEELMLPIPIMSAGYIRFSNPEEGEFNRCHASDKFCNVYYYDQVDVLSTESDSYSLDKTITIPFSDIKAPVHRIFWYAENQTHSDINIRGNYTTNSLNEEEGYSPVECTTIEKGSSKLLDRVKSLITEKIFPERHFCCVPKKKGLNCWTSSNHVSDNLIPPGFVLDGHKMIIKLSSQDPFKQSSDEKFKLQIIVVSTNCYYFSSYPKTEEERRTTKAVLELGFPR